MENKNPHLNKLFGKYAIDMIKKYRDRISKRNKYFKDKNLPAELQIKLNINRERESAPYGGDSDERFKVTYNKKYFFIWFENGKYLISMNDMQLDKETIIKIQAYNDLY